MAARCKTLLISHQAKVQVSSMSQRYVFKSTISKLLIEVCTYFFNSCYHNDLSTILHQSNWRVQGQLIGQMTWRRFPHSRHDVTRNREHSVEKKANMTWIIFRSRKLRTNTQPNFFGVSTFNPINFFSFSISFVRTFAWKPHFIIKGGT